MALSLPRGPRGLGTSVGDENIMTELSEQVTCPARVGADFHGDSTTLEGRELAVEGSLCGGQASFFDQFTLLVEDREVGVLVSQV